MSISLVAFLWDNPAIMQLEPFYRIWRETIEYSWCIWSWMILDAIVAIGYQHLLDQAVTNRVERPITNTYYECQ